MYKKDEYNIQTKCPVCGSTIYVNSVGNGKKCLNCSWAKSVICEDFPDKVICPNLISLSKARKLYKDGKSFKPDFDDFVDGFNFYGEMQFTYNGVIYGLMGIENEGVEFWGINTKEYKTFKNIEEFKQKAKVQGKLLKNIWNEVENANWLQ